MRAKIKNISIYTYKYSDDEAAEVQIYGITHLPYDDTITLSFYPYQFMLTWSKNNEL